MLVDEIRRVRKNIVYMAHNSKSSHIGACLSIVEILTVLYFKVMNIDPFNPKQKIRDKFLLSKGHASAALYAVLAERGFFDPELLSQYYINNGKLPGHLDKESVPGIESSSGSLGHGLSIGIGFAIADRKMGLSNKTYVLLGDGECNEGSVWEAVMLAAHLNLTNLIAIIDVNQLQGCGPTSEINNLNNLAERWTAFGWQVHEINGHNTEDIQHTLSTPQNKPKVLIANTIKGKGVSFMENKLEWHYKSPDVQQYLLALEELELIL